MLEVTAQTGSSRQDARKRDDTDVLDDPAWFLDHLDFGRDAAILTHTDREALSRTVFLDQRWDRGGSRQCAVPLSRLRRYESSTAGPALIWHTAFCCSTLIASCLDTPGQCLALKEPMALVDLNLARRGGLAVADERLTAGVLSHLGRGFDPGERVVIKPSNGANGLAPDAAAAGGPMLMLYSSCRDFLLAVIGGGPAPGGGEDRRRFVRDLMAERVISQRPPLRWRPEDLFTMTDLQVAALLWHTQVGEFRAVARAVGPARARALNCDTFLSHPAGVLAGLDRFFALGLGQARIGAIVQGAKLKQYAKLPSVSFDAVRRRRGFSDIEAELGPTLDALVAWSYQACPETPPGDPIGAPLMGLA